MEECESLDSEMTELQEFQYEASDVMSQDDEDEIEELQNSLREVVQDQSVKPKLQCLLVDPSFSMVTVQSEDSGIVWETASSRCSTPWASETSSTSEAYSMEGSGGAGKITIVFDEEKVVRRRTRSGGRSSRLGDRLSRPGSSRSASALGVERPEMAEVSLPNIKQEKTKPEADLEEIKTKDQQLFSLISEGYEILNIRVPSKLPTVDEEESTELQDNLSYLSQTPKIRSRIYQAQEKSHYLPEEEETPDHTETSEQDSSQPSAETQLGDTPSQKENTSDIDYFEKFTLLDVVAPAEQASEPQEEAEKPAAESQTEEPKPAKEVATDSPSVSEDSFVFVTDAEIVGEHLDEVFYGEGPPANTLQQRGEDSEEAGARMRGRRESQRSAKESGSVLFESEETTLTPIFISPGPPKIIDPILLEEPTAMSFMYSDLYEDAVGERRRSDEEYSEAESVASEKSYKRRLSDSEDADGYLEKFILKDETPTVDVQDELLKDESQGRMMWPQSKFEMTGCLIRVVEEEDKEKTKTEEAKMQEAGTEEDCHSAIPEEKRDIVTETKEEKEEIQHSSVAHEQTAREASEDSIQEPKKLMEVEQVNHEVKTDQLEPPEPSLEMAITEEKGDILTEIEAEEEETQLSVVSDEQAAGEASQNLTQEPKSEKQLMEVEQVKHEVKTDQLEPPEPRLETAKAKTEEPKTQEASVEEDCHPTITQKKKKILTETEEEKEETRLSLVSDEQAAGEASENLTQETKLVEEQMEVQQVKHEVETDQTKSLKLSPEKPPETQQMDIKAEKTHESMDHQRGDKSICEESSVDTEQPCEPQMVAEVLVVTTDTTALVVPVSTEGHAQSTESDAKTGNTERILLEGDAADSKMVAADEKLVTLAKTEALAQEQEAETVAVSSTEPHVKMEKSAEAPLSQVKEAAPEDVAPVEVFTDSDCTVQTVVEVTEKTVNENEIQTQVKIDLQEVTSVEAKDAQTEIHERDRKTKSPTEETAAEALLLKYTTEAEVADQRETSAEVIESVMSEEVNSESAKKHQEILETEQQQQELTEKIKPESGKTKLIPEANSEMPADDTKTCAQDTVNVGDELILLVPKGQAVEMDIEISKWPEKTEEDTVAEPDNTCDFQVLEPEPEVEAEVAVKAEELPRNSLDKEYLPPVPVEEANTEEQEVVFEEDNITVSPLRSFTPLEDLTVLHRDDVQSEDIDAEQKAEMHELKDAPETNIPTEDTAPYTDLDNEDVEQKKELNEEAPCTDLHSEDVEQKMEQHEEAPCTDLHSEDVEQKMEQHEEAPCTDLHSEDVEQKMEQHEEAPCTDLHSEDVEQKMEQHEEAPCTDLHNEDVEQKMEQHEEAPCTDLHREDVEQKMEQQEEAPCTDLHSEDVEQKMEQHEEAPCTDLHSEDVEQKMEQQEEAPCTDLHSEDVEQKMEQYGELLEAPDVPVEEPGYEVISKQDAKILPKSETQRDAEESHQKQEGEMELEVEIDQREDVVTEEELNEADYEIFDAEEESQARLAAELEGMDWFCVTCGCLLSEDEYKSAEHQDHEVNSVDKAYEEIKDALGGWISVLQARSENIEDLVSELELAYNSVEDQFVEGEAAMQAQNEEMMALVMEQYNSMSVSTEEEKKAKLEQLYDKIVSFQENIDSAKTTLETAVREAETDARSPEDIHARLKGALDSALSLELGPKGLLVFEDYAKANTSSSNLAQRKGIPVPQRPTLQPQESGSATSTSVTVYWKVNPGDIIDCFQVYCMEDPQGAVMEEYRVTVKESFCILEELEPDKMYKVWVMAVNYTGCSLPSERLVFRTAPSVPVIDTECCTVMWDSATLRWSSTTQSPAQTYTLEYCRQYELEGEGLRSISGIKACEQRVLLQPNENYLFYIKAVNEAGASEQSEAALISTKGTRFHLLKDSAHPALELSEDQTTLHCSQDGHNDIAPTEKVCPSILGDLLPARGLYYWETVVSGSTAYRLGVTYSTANKNSLGENNSSWCLQCIPTESSCRYQLLHNDVQASVCVIEIPERVGTLLDYQFGLLSFYNAQSGQLLGTFRQHFSQPCHPALALEQPGSLQLCLVPEVPEFTKDS